MPRYLNFVYKNRLFLINFIYKPKNLIIMKRITSFFAVLLIAMAAFAVDFTGGEFHINTTGTNDLGGPNYQWSAINAVFLNGTTESTVAAVQTGDKKNCTWSVQVPEGTWSTFSLVSPPPMPSMSATVLAADLEFDGTNNVIIVTQTSGAYSASFNGSQGTVPTSVAAEPEPETPVEPEVTGAKFYLDLATNSPAAKSQSYFPATATFSNEETSAEPISVEYNSTNFYEIDVPAGTWTKVYIKNKYYSFTLTFDGVNNCFVANKNADKPLFDYTDAGGTWSTYTPVVEEPENPEEPVGTVIAGGTEIFFDLSLNKTFALKTHTVSFYNATDTIDNVKLDTIDVNNRLYKVTAPAGNWTTVEYKGGPNFYYITLTEYDGVKNLFKLYSAASLVGGKNTDKTTDLDGVWMQKDETIAGTTINAKASLYFDPAALGDAGVSYKVVFIDYLNTGSTARVDMQKLSDGKYIFTNPGVSGVGAGSFSIFCHKSGECIARFDNLTWDGTTSLFTVNDDLKTGTWSEYTEPARIINTEWSIKSSEEGSEEGFSSVQVTFSGIDPNGRLLGGDATGINLVANFAKVASFFKVDDETGKETAVVTLTNKNNGFLTSTKISDFTYELSLVPDAYELVDGKYMREGHYRIKIQKSHVQIEPKPLNPLTASADFVFDFTIDNDYVFPTIIDDMTYYVEPAKSVVSEVGEVVVEFDADITLSELQEKPVLKFGEITYPLNCEIVDGYQLKLTIAQEGVEKLTENGFYEITIPEGFVYYDDPAEKNLNAEITIGFTIAPVMPANGVIYFDPSNEVVINFLVAKFVGGAGNTKEADVVQVGELYMIEMPKGDEWVRFDIEGWGVDPEAGNSNDVLLYSVSNLFYNGENNLFTLNEDAPANATAENGVWGKHVVTPIEGGTVFYLNVASSLYFTENAANFIWKTKFVNAEDEAGAEMDSIDLGIYKVVAPEGTWDMFLLYFNFNGTDREYMGVYLEYDGENDMFVFREDANVRALVGAWDKYEPNEEGGDATNVENAMLSTITVQDGMIMVEGEYQIYTITGQNVTSMNGSLEKGVYVVKSANAVVKVMVK